MRDTDTSDVFVADDYVLDETVRHYGNNCLLADDGQPNPDLTACGERALAQIASAVHRNARYLSPAQAELAVKWLKKWKLRDSVRADFDSMEAGSAFWQKLETLKVSPEQVRLQSVASRHSLIARVWGVVFAILLALTVGLLVSGSGWAWSIVAAAAAVGSAMASERSVVRALVAAKEQDRKYSLESIRAASTISDLLNAGLCAYMPGVLYGDPNYSERTAKVQSTIERERLADALYLDPDGYFDPDSYRDPGPV